MSYAEDVWHVYGVNMLDIWDLPAEYFFGMTRRIDAKRREDAKHK